jgi:hypothetical protein
MIDEMDRPTALRFADAVRAVSASARRQGLEVPAFRSPPRQPGVDRTIRRAAAGPVVAVRLRQRPFAEVADDLIEGVIVANALSGPRAERIRASLQRAMRASEVHAA